MQEKATEKTCKDCEHYLTKNGNYYCRYAAFPTSAIPIEDNDLKWANTCPKFASMDDDPPGVYREVCKICGKVVHESEAADGESRTVEVDPCIECEGIPQSEPDKEVLG